jgi:hypothetical protein
VRVEGAERGGMRPLGEEDGGGGGVEIEGVLEG